MSFSIARRRLLLTGAALGAAPTFWRKAATATFSKFRSTRPRPSTACMGHADAGRHDRRCRASLGAARLPAPPRTSPALLAAAACWCGPNSRSATPATKSRRTAIFAAKQGRKAWTDNPPTWQVQAWALRQAWTAEMTTGPDLQRQRQRPALLGALWRRRPGARSPSRPARAAGAVVRPDRSAPRHHAAAPPPPLIERDAGRSACAGSSKAASCCANLRPTIRAIAKPGNAYEWAMPTGGHGLRFATPRLIITSRRVGGGHRVDHPAAATRARVAAQHLGQARGRRPCCCRRPK